MPSIRNYTLGVFGSGLLVFGSGLLGGVTAATLYHLGTRAPATPNVRPPPASEGPVSHVPVSSPPTLGVPAHMTAAKEIMKYGFPGPVSDLLYRTAYVGSYNRSLRNPNWVAEHLTARSVAANPGVAGLLEAALDEEKPDRQKSAFREDQQIPRLFRAHLKDFVGSGFDRGHLVPAADVVESQDAMDETFLLTNISPQVGKGFNRNYWFYFEHFVRTLTKDFDDVYVITGPLYLPKLEDDGKHYVKYEMIGNPPNVAVPTHFYKVVLGVKGKTEAMATFVLPNTEIGDVPLQEFVLPLDAVERAAGVVFFPEVNRLAYKPLCGVIKCDLHKFLVAAKPKRRKSA
ncbi:uncharacterized protein EV422DRAFT_527077 [Fimicolochytrium jonesii]|uniref:uncharacterized protein n=1 Tax=Fimicolochytrium jonesii TaxID=1396493 RepID=UPI0022FDDDF0|nr:uncharacterized protein EV422DRAFT_527077 [Fimicolochytrium jonesii]KAI8821809.1 hypothetical protein EV422DRAFT_527077 [Fimicolochytrium jonesii]